LKEGWPGLPFRGQAQTFTVRDRGFHIRTTPVFINAAPGIDSKPFSGLNIANTPSFSELE